MPPVLPTVGLNRIADLIDSDSVYIAVGIGPTPPTSGDTQLEVEWFRDIALATRTGNLITFYLTILNANLPAVTTEMGLFMNASAAANSGSLLVRAIFTFDSTGGSDLNIVVTLRIDEG